MIGVCVIPARILWSGWKNAHGLGAGAGIAVLRGRCAEKGGTVPITHGYSEDVVLRLSDDDLLTHVYRWIEAVEDPDVSDALYWVCTEAFERFAPEAEWRTVERTYSDEADPRELDAARRAVRRRQGARILRDLFRESADDAR
jgi:hypothetical protein